MNLRHIEIFHAVYLHGSVSAAARALNVSQPSVTKTLRHAETILGFSLFERRGGRLIPTEEAHALFGDVSDIQSRVLSLRSASRNMRRGTAGTLRISALPSLALSVVPQTVARFLRRTPDVYFDLQTIHHDEIGRRLYEREADIVLAFEPPAGLPVVSRWLGEGELGLLHREQDLPNAPPRMALEDVADRNFISLQQSGPIGDLLRNELARQNLELNEIASARTYYIASVMVEEGAGMAVIDNFTAHSMVGRNLAFRPLRPSLAFDVYAIALENRPFSRRASEFLDDIATLLAGTT